MAKLNFKYGAMNSGKSTALINTAYNYRERGHNVLTIKPSIDVKGGQMIVARAGLEWPVDAIAAPDVDVRKVVRDFIKKQDVEELGAVLVDEAQFLTREQVDQLLEVAKLDNISVIAYGLKSDFLTNAFPGSLRLFELADTLEKLPTMCRCDNQATFNCRLVDGKYVFEGDQVAIDGEGEVTYESLCATCYLTEKRQALAA